MCVAGMTFPKPFGLSGATVHDTQQAEASIDEHGGTVGRLMFCNPALDSPERFERYGAVGRAVCDRTAR